MDVSAVDAVVAAAVALVLDLGETRVGRDYPFTDADSIDRVEIAEVVEEMLRPQYPRVAIDDEVLARVTTMGELADHTAQRLYD